MLPSQLDARLLQHQSTRAWRSGPDACAQGCVRHCPAGPGNTRGAGLHTSAISRAAASRSAAVGPAQAAASSSAMRASRVLRVTSS